MESERKGGKGTGEVALVGVVVYDFLPRSGWPGEDTTRHDNSMGTQTDP